MLTILGHLCQVIKHAATTSNPAESLKHALNAASCALRTASTVTRQHHVQAVNNSAPPPCHSSNVWQILAAKQMPTSTAESINLAAMADVHTLDDFINHGWEFAAVRYSIIPGMDPGIVLDPVAENALLEAQWLLGMASCKLAFHWAQRPANARFIIQLCLEYRYTKC